VEGILFPDDGRVLESNGPSRSCSVHHDELLGMIIYDFIAHEAPGHRPRRATTGKDGARGERTAGRTDR